MSRVLVVALFVLPVAACGKKEPGGAVEFERRAPAAGLLRIVVRTAEASVELATREGSDIIVESTREASLAIKENSARVDYAGGGTLRVTAPPGLDLVVNQTGGGDVAIEGSWGALKLEAGDGTVSAKLADCVSARITTGKGSIGLSIENPPGGNVYCASTRGKVDLVAPSDFRGLASLSTQQGEIKVAEHPNLSVRSRSATAANVFVGKMFTRKEHEEAPVDKRPAFWGKAWGGVTFALR